jgi:aspartate oxidase
MLPQARLIAKAAKRNQHSVGAHFIEDSVDEEEEALVTEQKAAM